MTDLARIVTVLARVECLAGELQHDADGHVRRSASELRVAFEAHSAIEPAVARVRDSVDMLRRANRDGCRRESQRRAQGVDRFVHVVEQELLPNLRRVGFDV
jgi:hypothetical protein